MGIQGKPYPKSITSFMLITSCNRLFPLITYQQTFWTISWKLCYIKEKYHYYTLSSDIENKSTEKCTLIFPIVGFLFWNNSSITWFMYLLLPFTSYCCLPLNAYYGQIVFSLRLFA